MWPFGKEKPYPIYLFSILKLTIMKSFQYIMMVVLLLSFAACEAQISNSKTITATIDGNCSMCKKTIETSGYKKKLSQIAWNKDTKTAIITFDSTKTNANEILKRVALAGYDNESFLAPDTAYTALPECCQYERTKKTTVLTATSMAAQHTAAIEQDGETTALTGLFHAYFDLKDALVSSDASAASVKAKAFTETINAVKMTELTHQAHSVFMKILPDLKTSSDKISKNQNLTQQRIAFSELSEVIYPLFKNVKQTKTVFYQHCPMFNDGKGANWLSTESSIKNPYYGAAMLSCGKTIESLEP